MSFLWRFLPLFPQLFRVFSPLTLLLDPNAKCQPFPFIAARLLSFTHSFSSSCEFLRSLVMDFSACSFFFCQSFLLKSVSSGKFCNSSYSQNLLQQNVFQRLSVFFLKCDRRGNCSPFFCTDPSSIYLLDESLTPSANGSSTSLIRRPSLWFLSY